jgi:hypothetical protein
MLGQATQQVILDLMGKVNKLGEEERYIDTAIANLKAGRPENWSPARPSPEEMGGVASPHAASPLR